MRHLVRTRPPGLPLEAKAGPEPSAPPQPPEELLSLARQYESISDSSYRVRLTKKEEAASQLLTYVMNSGISKANLFAWAAAQPSDGLIVTCASYVLSYPENADLAPLLQVGGRAKWLHVKFRVAMALRALLQENYGTPEEWKRAVKLLRDYLAEANRRQDTPLSEAASQLIDTIAAKLA
jgi:hypothetical protein